MRKSGKKIKKILSILLTIGLLLSMTPAALWADDPLTGNETSLDVGRLKNLTEDVTGGSNWTYTFSSKTLNITTGDTAAGFVLTGENDGLKRINATDVHLVLDGANIKASGASSGQAVTAGGLTVQNGSVLVADSGVSMGIRVTGNVSVTRGSAVTVATTNTSYQGLYALGDITIDNSVVTVRAKWDGIYSGGKLEITGGSKVESFTKNSTADDSGTAISAQGDIVIDGGEVWAEGGTTSAGYTGITGRGGVISISNGSKVTASGVVGINADSRTGGGKTDLTIADSEVSATGEGSPSAGDGYGIRGPLDEAGTANLTISGGTVKAGGSTAEGIWWKGGSIVIIGGSVNTATTKQPKDAAGTPVYKTALTLQNAGNAKAVTGSIVPPSGSYSLTGVKIDADGKIYLWLPAGDSTLNLTAGGYTYSGNITLAADNNNTHSLPGLRSIDLSAVNPAGGDGYTVSSGLITFTGSDNYNITGSTTTYALKTAPGAGTARLTLNDINIASTGRNALTIDGNTTMNLHGENTLTGDGGGSFGIFGATDADDKTLTIYGPGTLNANGVGLSLSGTGEGNPSAPINQLTVKGGTLNTHLFAGKITIDGGTVNAVTTEAGSGLEAGGSITINGGSVKAQGTGLKLASPRPQNSGGQDVYMTTLAGLPVDSTVTALTQPAGYGYTDMKTDREGKLYLWLPEGDRQIALEVGSASVNESFAIAANDNNLFAAGAIAVNAATGTELKAALQGTLPSTVTLTGNITLTEVVGAIATGASHTLNIPPDRSLTISSTAVITVGAGQILNVEGGGTLTIAKAIGSGVWGDGTLNLENITVNLKNTEVYGLNVKTVNVNQNATVKLNSATGGALIHITYEGSVNVNSGGVIRIEDFMDVGILNAGGTLNIAGGTVSVGRGRGNNEGIDNNKALISGGTAYGGLKLSAGGALTPESGGRIYLLAQSQVEGMSGRLVDRGTILSENGLVTVGTSSLPPFSSGLAEGYYTGDGYLFHRQLIIINQQPQEEVTVTQGRISASLLVGAAAGASPVQYQWHQWSESENGYIAIAGETSGTFAIPADLTATGGYQGSGEYYFACGITAEGYEPALIEVMVTVAPPGPVTAYTVSFDAGGGSVSPASAQTGADGRLTEGLPVPRRSGYSFAGWFTARTGGTQVAEDRVYTESTTIYARWNDNGGGGDGDEGDGDNGGGTGGNGGGSGSGTGSAPGYVADSAITTGEQTVTVQLGEQAGGARLTSAQLSTLTQANRDKAVVIQGTDYSITFPAGSMSGGFTGEFNPGVSFNQGETLKAIQALGGSRLLLMVDFAHSGALPGPAEIRFRLTGVRAGDTVDYYYYNPETGRLDYVQSAVVDQDGYVTVTQTHCSQYAFLLSEGGELAPGSAERIYGETRYDTAAAIARAAFAGGTDTVILARGDISADALPAVPLARQYNAPLLLTEPETLPEAVLSVIKELGAKKVIIIGGPGAISPAVEDELKAGVGAELAIERIYGQSHYDTAYEIARRLTGTTGEAALVNGNAYEETFPDALSVSAWAGYHGAPILYADSTQDRLPESTAKALEELKISRTLVIGGTGVIPARLEALVPNPERYGGTTLYDTNVLVLKNLQAESAAVYAATGEDFADALAGAAAAARSNGLLILTGGAGDGGLTPGQEELLKGMKDRTKSFHVFGGPAAVPESALETIKSLLER